MIGNLLKEQLFGPLCSPSLLSLALDPSIELPIERAFAHLYCVPAPLLIEFITPRLVVRTPLCKASKVMVYYIRIACRARGRARLEAGVMLRTSHAVAG